jgi:hypothetical protein
VVVGHGGGLGDRGVDTVGCLAVGVDYGMGTRYAYGCWVWGRLRPLLRHLVRHGWWGLVVTSHVLRLASKGGRHTRAGVNGASRIKNSILRLSILRGGKESQVRYDGDFVTTA